MVEATPNACGYYPHANYKRNYAYIKADIPTASTTITLTTTGNMII
jgi:hypothetical protein